jgi:hypothetical protein
MLDKASITSTELYHLFKSNVVLVSRPSSSFWEKLLHQLLDSLVEEVLDFKRPCVSSLVLVS